MVAVEEGKHPVILLLLERVELVIVALRALDGEAKHGFAEGIHAVEHPLHAELLGVDGTLHVHHGIAEETRGHALILSRVGEFVPGDLLDEKLIIGQVAVEGVDDVIAIRPHLARHVLLVAIAVRVTRRVEPVAPPAFAVMRRGQQLLGGLLVSVLRRVIEERIHLLHRRRQAHQVQVQPAQQRDAIRLRRRLQSLGIKFREDEVVDGRADPSLIARRDNLGAHGCFEGPMLFRIFLAGRHRHRGPRDALINPRAQQAHLLGSQAVALLWHLEVGMRVRHRLNQHTLRAASGNDDVRAEALAALERRGFFIEPQGGLLLLRTVAGPAVVLEDGLNVLREIHRARDGWRNPRWINRSRSQRGPSREEQRRARAHRKRKERVHESVK